MRISWGWRIMILYGGFVAMIIALIVACSHQKIDLVSKDYYKDEIAYQQVLDASKNQADLAGVLSVHANEHAIVIDFPHEFSGQVVKGSVNLYSAANQAWDREFDITAVNNNMSISREHLQKTIYAIKVSYSVEGKSYYYETKINLHG
jgi:hypothetical protein